MTLSGAPTKKYTTWNNDAIGVSTEAPRLGDFGLIEREALTILAQHRLNPDPGGVPVEAFPSSDEIRKGVAH
jgi:hypothetical protein